MSLFDPSPPAPLPPPVLVTTIDLGEKGSETLMIFNNDDPFQVARDFCAKHGLPDAVVEPLTAHILDNLGSTDTKTEPVHEQPAENSPKLSQAEDVCAKPTDSLLKEVEEVTSRVNAELNASAAAAAAAAAVVPPPSPTPPSADEEDGFHSDGSHQTAIPLISRPSSANSNHGMTTMFARAKAILPSSTRTVEENLAPAVDRLYADHFRKQRMLEEQRRIRELQAQLATQRAYCTPVSRVLASHRSARGYTSYGERLYVEGRMDALKRERAAKAAKETEEAEEMAAVTFRPEISKMAKALKTLERSRARSSPWRRLYTRSSTLKKEKRAEMIRLEQEEEELRECSFHPRIDSRSKALVRARREVGADPWAFDTQSDDLSDETYDQSSFHHHHHQPASTVGQVGERLYRQGLYRKQRADAKAQAWLPDEATFRPHLIASSSSLSIDNESDGKERDVAERLMQKGIEYAARREAIKEALQAPIDQQGRELFKPMTWKPRRSNFSVANGIGGIGDYLYMAAKKSIAKATKAEEEAAKKAKLEASTTHVNQLSDKMMDRLKNERLKAIFNYLLGCAANGNAANGSGGDLDPISDVYEGVVCREHVDLEGVIKDERFMDTIDPEVRTDVEHAAALWLQKQNNHKVHGMKGPLYIDVETFTDLMHEVLNKTRGIARRYLMPLGSSSRRKWEEPSFRPDVAPKSKALAARLRPSGVPTHEILYQTAQQIKAKKEVVRQELEQASLAACSFKPTFVSAQLVKKGRALRIAGQQESTGEEGNGGCGGLTKEEGFAQNEKEINEVNENKENNKTANRALEDGIDVIERQIRHAVARLNASGEALMKRLGKDSQDDTITQCASNLWVEYGMHKKLSIGVAEQEEEEPEWRGASLENNNDNELEETNTETNTETGTDMVGDDSSGKEDGDYLVSALGELHINVNVADKNSVIPQSGKLAAIAATPLAF